jgi:hypothetical protein
MNQYKINFKVVLLSAYVKSTNSIDFSEIKNKIFNLINQYMEQNIKMVICGDFNCTSSNKFIR